MAKKQRLFGQAISLVGTTIEKAESVTYEVLTTIELGAKALTNIVEEMHNDSIVDLIDSRLAVAEKLTSAETRMKQLGYSPDLLNGMLCTDRRISVGGTIPPLPPKTTSQDI